MSIGLVLKHTYQETCEICEVISKFASKLFHKMITTFEVMGTSRAASQLAQMGYYEEAKHLMLEVTKKK